MQDKMNIYRLCHNSDYVTQADFNALSHLPVPTMLDVIQAHFAISGNYEQSKQLLAWTMGTKFVDSCGAMEVSKMLGSARSDGALSHLQASLSVKELGNMRVASKRHIAVSVSTFSYCTIVYGPRWARCSESCR